MAHSLHPPDSLKKGRKSVPRHSRKVFGRLVDALWADPFFHLLRPVADEMILANLPQYGSPDAPAVSLFDALVVALKVPGDVSIATSGRRAFRASPAFEPVANLLGAGLRRGAIALCSRLGIDPSPGHLIWIGVCMLWPAMSAEELKADLSDVAGMGLYTIDLATLAIRPEAELPADVLRREALDFRAELVSEIGRSSPLAVPWTRAGRPDGSTEIFRSSEDFRVAVRTAIKAVKKQGRYPSAERVADYLFQRGKLAVRENADGADPVRQLRRYYRERYNYPGWEAVLKDLDS